MLAFLAGLKTKAIEFGVLILAICSGLLYERHKGKQEGEQIAAGKSAQAVQHSSEVANTERAKAQQGDSQTELGKEFGR